MRLRLSDDQEKEICDIIVDNNADIYECKSLLIWSKVAELSTLQLDDNLKCQ